MSFAFFVPTGLIGPINPISNYISSFNNKMYDFSDILGFILRILYGSTKILFLGTIFQKMSFDSFLFDGLPHHYIDLYISGIFFYVYLYINFSGFCDIVIGTSGLMGIKVSENFENPLVARNIKEFWNRWHLTLSHFLRDTLFTHVTLLLTRYFGTKYINHIISFSILLVFLLIGLWHGTKLNYLLFGLAHAFGMITHHYYTLLIKKYISKEKINKYNKSLFIRIISTVITFSYVVFTMILFGNDISKLLNFLIIIR